MPVEPSDRALVTLEEVARLIGTGEVDLEDDTTADTLQELVNEASEFIALDTGREFIWVHGLYDDTETRTIPFTPGAAISIGDVQEIDSISLNGTELTEDDWLLTAAAGYAVFPPNVLSLSPTLSYSAVAWPSAYYPSDILEIEGTWGFATVPELIKRACKLIVEAWYQRDVQLTSDSYDEETGNLGVTTEAVRDRTFAIPFPAEQILAKFRLIGTM